MALVRILVDGYSLLHYWVELAPGRPRHSAAAREELIHILRHYQDASRTPITVVFDGDSKSSKTSDESSASLEIIYSQRGQTADQIIERVAYRMRPYGEVMAVTDDGAERSTVLSLGGMACGCENFVRLIENEMRDLDRSIVNYNRGERERFKRPKS
jgi:hypothetical protein